MLCSKNKEKQVGYSKCKLIMWSLTEAICEVTKKVEFFGVSDDWFLTEEEGEEPKKKKKKTKIDWKN